MGQRRLREAAGVRAGAAGSATRRPNIPFPSYFNVNATQDVAVSLTKVTGRHTIKTGFFNTHSYKAEQATGADSFGNLNFQQDTVGTNAFDTSFGFANAAIGSFSSYTQASNYIEGNFVYDNREAYVQDNWKVNNRLTLDYGMRFVNALPQYDKLGQGSNFLPDKWTPAAAPLLYPSGLRRHRAAGHRLSGGEPAGAESRSPASCSGPNTSLGDRHARAGHRQPDQRPVHAAATGSSTRPTRSRRSRWRRASAWPTT